MHLLTGKILFGRLHLIVGLTRSDCIIVQVDLVCHGKTEVFPDKDGSDPYAVSTGSFLSLTVMPALLYCNYMVHVLCKRFLRLF